ncbi:hypothetical protein [Enterococcus sp. SMC-9]|uniref:hypothetical protein n=1 Tax=Enterococcus sp. SMC-9 TaxID=2862343 RepID=UPI001E34373C|nr:hypothetical protein [Enterococcus sp. SMC-9]MCD1025818.1 hypothetical protein [Enterococcus sp. SMC-9]
MSKKGLNINEILYIEKLINDEHELAAQVEDGYVMITTTDLQNIKQHDFSMSKAEWEIFKRIIDLNLEQEEKR